MITPRQTRLVPVSDLHAFRRAILSLSKAEPGTKNREPVVLVPTRSAARQLGAGLTRDELYERLRRRLSNPPQWLTAIERDVIAQAAADATASSGIDISFELRPGLVAEMLRFYDQLRRHSQQVSRFEALIEAAIDGADTVSGWHVPRVRASRSGIRRL